MITPGQRRTSGEVINATLLEVFLALSFVLFGLAVFEKRRAVEAENELEASATINDSLATARDALGVAQAALVTVVASRDSLVQQLATAESENDSLKFVSRIPPDCDPHASPAELLTITLAGTDRLVVRANRAAFDWSTGEESRLNYRRFASRFAVVREFSRSHGCRFPVRIVDTEHTSKEDFKRALAVINSTFRPRGYLR